MNGKNTKPVRLSVDTMEKLKSLKRELSLIEKKDLSMGIIIDRILKGEDIPQRLKLGSFERRKT